jgi:hypothetical protein
MISINLDGEKWYKTKLISIVQENEWGISWYFMPHHHPKDLLIWLFVGNISLYHMNRFISFSMLWFSEKSWMFGTIEKRYYYLICLIRNLIFEQKWAVPLNTII